MKSEINQERNKNMDKNELYSKVEAQYDDLKDMAMKIWEYAETAHQEVQSSRIQ